MSGFEGRYLREDGYILGFESFDQAGDFTPIYRGLPESDPPGGMAGVGVAGHALGQAGPALLRTGDYNGLEP